MSRRNIFLALVVAASLFIGLWLWLRTPEINLVLNGPVANNIQFPEKSTANKIRFFTGSGFAELDTVTGKTRALSRIMLLPLVSEVRWGGDEVLFLASGYSASDELSSLLAQKSLPESRPYWWKYSLSSGQFELVGESVNRPLVEDAFWSSGSSPKTYYFTLVGQEEGSKKDLYEAKPGLRPQLISSPSNVLKFIEANSSHILFSRSPKTGEGQVVLLKRATGREEVLPTGNFIGKISRSSSGDIAYLVPKEAHSETAIGDLYVLSDGKKRLLLKDFDGNYLWSRDKLIGNGYTAEDPISFLYEDGALKTKDLQTKEQVPRMASSTLLSEKPLSFLMVDRESQAYIASEDRVQVKDLPDESKLRKPMSQSGFYLIYDESEKRYFVYILQDSFSQGAQNAIKYIRSQGIDPYQLDIKWYAKQ